MNWFSGRSRYIRKIDRSLKNWKPVKLRKVSRIKRFGTSSDDDCGGDN